MWAVVFEVIHNNVNQLTFISALWHHGKASNIMNIYELIRCEIDENNFVKNENRAERLRGFESLSLRTKSNK